METMCDCGAEATFNGRECPPCARDRIGSVRNGFTPTRSDGAARSVGPDRHRAWEGRLEDYAKVRAEGSQPNGTDQASIDAAKSLSDQMGEAFRADSPTGRTVAA